MADLFSKRGARRVFAAAAVTALVGSLAVSGVSAQTATTPAVATSLAVVGPVPGGVTGFLVAVTCNNLQGIAGATGTANAGSQTLSALFPATGGSQALPFTLNAPNAAAGLLGSTCSATVTAQGSANLGAAGYSVSFGGATVVAPGGFLFRGTGASFTTGVVPVQGGTTLAVTVSYPQITVRKVVDGDEPVAAFAYPMTITCANPAAVAGDPVVLVPPVGPAGGFTGTFTLAGGASRVFGISQFPLMTISTLCEVRETNSQGAALGYSSTNGFVTGTTTPAPALLGVIVAGNFQSSLTAMNQTVTVTNSFVGDLIVSKVVTGDPKTNIAAYEISVACDKGGPKETFLLRDRQSKVYTGIAAGVNCLVTETRSDGATASYHDNSGDNTTDGRVTIRLTTPGCGQGTNITGSNSCIASVIVTNSYVPVTTVAPVTAAAAPTTAAAAPVTAAPVTTAAAPVDAAPAPEVEAEASFTG